MGQKTTQSALYMREWVIVYLFLALLLTIAALSYSKKHSLIAPETKINVTVMGAVREEINLQIHALSTVADVLALVDLLDDADLDKLIIDERVKPGIFIMPKKQKTAVYATGAVKKMGVHYVPEGCRFNELVEFIPTTSDADMRYFTRKRRRVAEGELIVVPSISQSTK